MKRKWDEATGGKRKAKKSVCGSRLNEKGNTMRYQDGPATEFELESAGTRKRETGTI